MRRCRLVIMTCLPAAAMVLAASFPAAGGQPNSGLDIFGVVPGGSTAESGKPMLGGWPLAAPDDGAAAKCAPPPPCGTRLRGSVRKDGAVELQVPALRW